MKVSLSGDQLLQECAGQVRSLQTALVELEQQALMFRLPGLVEQEWYQLLRQKLIPQLGERAFLVAAVVGGTNIGKSVIFNHLAGCRASATSPLASGTRHPTCLVPENFLSDHRLEQVFPDFQLQRWTDPSLALEETETHQLFWREEKSLPESLLILDTPDIDSDARINWVRADAVRRSADVLIAVLTQQKYNDAAVREFFRRAGDEGRAVIVIFNQVLLPEDEPYWPQWLETFCRATGLQPEAVYLAPADRRAAEDLRLPFFERRHGRCRGGEGDAVSVDPEQPVNPGAHLSRLRFADIRMQTLRGSLRELLHPQRGVGGWLKELRVASQELEAATSRLTAEGLIQIRHWPAPANSVFVAELRKWWQQQQTGWARSINSAYNAVGKTLLWPLQAAGKALRKESPAPLDDYREREWLAVLNVVEEVFERLQWMAESGNALIRERLEQLLAGDVRNRLMTTLRQRHQEVGLEAELERVIAEQMAALQLSQPEVFRLYQQLNNVSAAVRPVTSIVLFSLGFGPAGDLVAPLLGHAAASAVVHVVADVAGGTTAAIAGEAAVSSVAGAGSGLLQTWFHRLQTAFSARRAAWLSEQLHRELLGTLPEELHAAVGLRTSSAWLRVQQHVQRLESLI